MPQFIQNIEEIRQRASRKIEDGAVTEGYKGDVHRSVEILNEALATEIVCVLRYQHHYFMATGLHGRSVADEFKEHADEEREHADLIAERIQQLGGKPNFDPKGLLERSVSQYVEGETLADMIKEDLIAERVVIEVYQQMIRHFGDNDPTTRRMLEHLLAEEEEHASDLSDMLFVVDPGSGETAGEDPGTNPLLIGTMSKGTTSSRDEENEEMITMKKEPLRTTDQAPEPFAGRGTVVEPAHAGTVGRTVDRRENRSDIEDTEAATEAHDGASSGSSRSVKTTNKRRKDRVA